MLISSETMKDQTDTMLHSLLGAELSGTRKRTDGTNVNLCSLHVRSLRSSVFYISPSEIFSFHQAKIGVKFMHCKERVI